MPCHGCPQTCDFGRCKVVNLDLLESVSCRRGDTEVFGQLKLFAAVRYSRPTFLFSGHE